MNYIQTKTRLEEILSEKENNIISFEKAREHAEIVLVNFLTYNGFPILANLYMKLFKEFKK